MFRDKVAESYSNKAVFIVFADWQHIRQVPWSRDSNGCCLSRVNLVILRRHSLPGRGLISLCTAHASLNSPLSLPVTSFISAKSEALVKMVTAHARACRASRDNQRRFRSVTESTQLSVAIEKLP